MWKHGSFQLDIYIYKYNKTKEYLTENEHVDILLAPHMLFPLKEVMFLNKAVYIPIQTHEYLILRYGKDYNTPRRHDKSIDKNETYNQMMSNMLDVVVTWRDIVNYQIPH